MNLSEHVFLYCERGTSTLLLAEPWNAASNAGFIVVGLIAIDLLLRRPVEQRSADQFLLASLILLIGLGSLPFHVFASRGAELADVIPISIFMLVYLGFALNRFLGTPPGWTVLLVIGFVAIAGAAGQLKCWDGAIGIPGSDVTGAGPCLNGSVAYLPALFALIVIGVLMRERDHRGAPFVLWAAAIFAISITLRSVDLSVCSDVVYEGHKIGTHFVWHLLNAGVLFLLFLASFRAGEAAAPAVVTATIVEAEPEKAPSAVQQLALKQEAERLRKEEEEAKKDAPKDKEPDKKEEAQKVTLAAFGSGHAAAPTEDEKEGEENEDEEKEEEKEKEKEKDKEDESSPKSEPST
jgi:hypothetical protein